MTEANNTPIPSQEPPPDAGAEAEPEWLGEYSFDPDAWFRDMIAPMPDFDEVPMTPEELAAAEAEPWPEVMEPGEFEMPPEAWAGLAEATEDDEAERLLHGMAPDGNAWLRDAIGRQQRGLN